MKKPERREQVLESRRVATSLGSIHAAAWMAGFEWFAAAGTVYEVTGQALGQYEAVGLLSELFPEEGRKTGLPKDDPAEAFEIGAAEGPAVTVIDGVYAYPTEARRAALALPFEPAPDRYKGLRSPEADIPEDWRGAFEEILAGQKVGSGYTAFHLYRGGDQLVYHSDLQRWAAAVFLTPGAPPQAGLSFWRSRAAKTVRSSADLGLITDGEIIKTREEAEKFVYEGALLDRTRWEEVDRVGNVFNRLVVWDARLVHSVSEVFGDSPDTGRLVQLFFWDAAS